MTNAAAGRPGFLSQESFVAAVAALPLVSMDLCVTNPAGQLLVGLRVNPPACGFWFTPGGRIRKGEGLPATFARLVRDEIGLYGLRFDRAHLMGAWDHFYDDSAFSASVSTHYVNLPYWIAVTEEEAARISADEQHSDWRWLDISGVGAQEAVHSYVRPYVDWVGRKIAQG